MSVFSEQDKINFFKKVFGSVDVTTGGNIQVKCPKCVKAHKDMGIKYEKKKLAINVRKNDVFHCWVCDYSGQMYFALRKYFPKQIAEEYNEKFGKELSLPKEEEKEDDRKIPFKVPLDFRMLCNTKLDYKAKKAIDYLNSRGMTEKDFWRFRIGISDEFPWGNRVIFPSINKDGEIDCFVGRYYNKDDPKGNYFEIGKHKKHDFCFNEININWSKELTITEGVFDLVKCNHNAVPLLGSSMMSFSYLFGKILQHKTPVLVATDKDMQYKKMPSMIRLILESGSSVRVLDFGDYKDVAEMPHEEFLERRFKAKVWDRMSLVRHKISMIGI